MEGENIDSSEFMSEGLIELPQKDKPFAGSKQVCMPRGFTNLKEYVCMYVTAFNFNTECFHPR